MLIINSLSFMKRLLFVFNLLLFTWPIFSQSPVFQGEKEKYILVNGDPYLALLNGNGKILKLIRKAPEILKQFSNSDKRAIEEYYAERDLPEFTPDRKEVVSNKQATSFTGSEYLTFGFSEYRARLNKVQITQLQTLASEYKNGLYSTISLKTIMYEQGNDGSTLANNRSAACADLLKIFGVPESALSIDLVQMAETRPEVKIYVN